MRKDDDHLTVIYLKKYKRKMEIKLPHSVEQHPWIPAGFWAPRKNDEQSGKDEKKDDL
jgi:hypothetical protein